MNNPSSIRACTCEHIGQDELHGKKQRVFNKTEKGWRCTVCLKEIEVPRNNIRVQ